MQGDGDRPALSLDLRLRLLASRLSGVTILLQRRDVAERSEFVGDPSDVDLGAGEPLAGGFGIGLGNASVGLLRSLRGERARHRQLGIARYALGFAKLGIAGFAAGIGIGKPRSELVLLGGEPVERFGGVSSRGCSLSAIGVFRFRLRASI